jgi:hypothetical protein
LKQHKSSLQFQFSTHIWGLRGELKVFFLNFVGKGMSIVITNSPPTILGRYITLTEANYDLRG